MKIEIHVGNIHNGENNSRSCFQFPATWHNGAALERDSTWLLDISNRHNQSCLLPFHLIFHFGWLGFARLTCVCLCVCLLLLRVIQRHTFHSFLSRDTHKKPDENFKVSWSSHLPIFYEEKKRLKTYRRNEVEKKKKKTSWNNTQPTFSVGIFSRLFVRTSWVIHTIETGEKATVDQEEKKKSQPYESRINQNCGISI